MRVSADRRFASVTFLSFSGNKFSEPFERRTPQASFRSFGLSCQEFAGREPIAHALVKLCQPGRPLNSYLSAMSYGLSRTPYAASGGSLPGKPYSATASINGLIAMKQVLIGIATVLVAGLCAMQPAAAADGVYVVKPVTEKRVKQLPDGPLYWRIENFPTLAQAQAAIGPDRWNPNTVSYDGATSLAAEVAGKDWLFTLGPKGGSTPGGTEVAEIGPVPPITAPEYLLRINHGSGPPGAKTPQHSHPGSEAFYVISGQLGQRTPQGVSHVDAGHTMNGHSAGMPMEVFNSGTTDLSALIMCVVDATKPFSSPAQLHSAM